jgi:hypothetical protein
MYFSRFEDLDIDGRIILKCYSELWAVNLWVVSHYLRRGSHDEISKQVNEHEDITTVFWDVAM